MCSPARGLKLDEVNRWRWCGIHYGCERLGASTYRSSQVVHSQHRRRLHVWQRSLAVRALGVELCISTLSLPTREDARDVTVRFDAVRAHHAVWYVSGPNENGPRCRECAMQLQ